MDPVLSPVLLIIAHKLLNLTIDESVHFLLESFRQLLNKLHTLAAPRLLVRLLQIVLDVLGRLILILVNVNLCNCNIGQDEDRKNLGKVGSHEVLILLDASTITQVPQKCKN